jgi:hypothetical protein
MSTDPAKTIWSFHPSANAAISATGTPILTGPQAGVDLDPSVVGAEFAAMPDPAKLLVNFQNTYCFVSVTPPV